KRAGGHRQGGTRSAPGHGAAGVATQSDWAIRGAKFGPAIFARGGVMSSAAEPYAQFVQDIVLALTGGVSRQEFQFLPENLPFRLSAPGPIVPSSVEVFGQAHGAYRRFLAPTDYT